MHFGAPAVVGPETIARRDRAVECRHSLIIIGVGRSKRYRTGNVIQPPDHGRRVSGEYRRCAKRQYEYGESFQCFHVRLPNECVPVHAERRDRTHNTCTQQNRALDNAT